MTGIINYGVGNLFSLTESLMYLGEDVIFINREEDYKKVDHLILPGVGAFIPAREELLKSGLEEGLREEVKKGKPLLGICLGMQLLFDKGFEGKECRGLGLIPGEVKSIKEKIREGNKIPHIGWNNLFIKKESLLFKKIQNGDYVYFVHSYSAVECDEYITSVTDYDGVLTSSVERDNVFGFQFHPEKSGQVGLSLLSSFLEVE